MSEASRTGSSSLDRRPSYTSAEEAHNQFAVAILEGVKPEAALQTLLQGIAECREMAREAGTTNYLVNKVSRVTFDPRDTANAFVTLQRKIGQGHSGTVWAATLYGADRRQQYSVAVK
eukprot:1322418-Amphidinium_carterae.1